jgi:hypothetical protein
MALVRASGVFREGDDFTLIGLPFVCDATPYLTESEIPGLMRVGDADAALDPLSSSGVQAAIQSALTAGPIVNTLLTPGEDEAAAVEFWRRRRNSQARRHRRWASQLYSEAFVRHRTRFWAERCEATDGADTAIAAALPGPDQLIWVAPSVNLSVAPCLVGNLVKRLECVDHTSLSQPVAFAAGIYIPPLLRRATMPATARAILAAWSDSVPPALACLLLGWAWRNGILVGVPTGDQRVEQAWLETH